MPAPRPLAERIALVTGGTRGAGRAIAVELGTAGATVYVTGRTTANSSSPMNRPETIEETAALIDAAGGRGIALPVDHSQPAEIQTLADTIAKTFGRLDILVNDIWGGDAAVEWGKPFWEQDLAIGRTLLHQSIDTHLMTSWHMAPLLLASDHGLIVEITDGVSHRYRGSLFYDLIKSSLNRLAIAQAEDFRPSGVAVLAVSPGFLRSEAMLDHFGVTSATWQEAIAADPHFAYSETPHYLGRAVVALAADPKKMEATGTITATWELAKKYGLTDLDGTQPDWGHHFRTSLNLEP